VEKLAKSEVLGTLEGESKGSGLDEEVKLVGFNPATRRRV